MKVACAQPVQKRRQSQSTMPSRRRDSRLQLKESLRGLSYDEQCAALRPVQQKGPGGTEGVQQAAAEGVKGAGGTLPYADKIQDAFGKHDISSIQSYQGGDAKGACESMGAEAYASGDSVAFKGNPTLHTAAHEAAHIVQQRAGVSLKGGVGVAGDQYEQHADAVADLVVQGKSAEGLLDTMSGGSASSAVQRKAVQKEGEGTANGQCKNTNGLRLKSTINDYVKISQESITSIGEYLESLSTTLNLLIRVVSAGEEEQADYAKERKDLLAGIQKQGVFSRIANLFGGMVKLVGSLGTITTSIITSNPVGVVTGGVGVGSGIGQIHKAVESDNPDVGKVGLASLVDTVQKQVTRVNGDLAGTNENVADLTVKMSGSAARKVEIYLSGIQESITRSPTCPPESGYTPEFITQVRKSMKNMKNRLDKQLVDARECQALANAVAAGGARALKPGTEERGLFDEMAHERATDTSAEECGALLIHQRSDLWVISPDMRMERPYSTDEMYNREDVPAMDSNTLTYFMKRQVVSVDKHILCRQGGSMRTVSPAMANAVSSLPHVEAQTYLENGFVLEGSDEMTALAETVRFAPEWYQDQDLYAFIERHRGRFTDSAAEYLNQDPMISWESN